MVVSTLLLLVSFALLLIGAFVFTNAVEWAGMRLNLGQGAVGSILAAVATALPESVVPVVAIISGDESGAIAIGAIIGAPFLLGTLAMCLVGLTAIIFAGRRDQGRRLTLDTRTIVRDLGVFLVFLALALVLGLLHVPGLNIAAAVVFVVAYGIYVWRTIAGGGAEGEEVQMRALFFDPSKHSPPHNAQIVLQVVVGLGLIIGGAQLFVVEIEHIAVAMGVTPLVLALVLAPLASELPEKVNSFLWIRRGKDTLAMGNITGAMVFQSMLPVAVGLAFTHWRLEAAATVVTAAALLGGGLAALVVWRVGQFRVPFVAAWGVLYAVAVGYVVATA